MDVRSLFLIAMFEFLNTTMGVWNANSSLKLVDITTSWGEKLTKIFPSEIPSRMGRHYISSGKYYAFCPNPDAPNKNCNYGNLPNGVSGNMAVQLEDECLNPVIYNVVPELIPLLNNQMLHKQCVYNQKQGHLYHFVYLLCKDNDKEASAEKIIYKVCYRDDQKQTILASAAIAKPSLLRDALLHDEQTYQFVFDGAHYFDDYTRDIIDVSATLYDESPNYEAAFVLPPVFFPLAHQRKPFYHHMNLAPMDKTLTAEWEHFLDRLVENKLSQHSLPLNVYAGLLGVLQDDQGNDVYLGTYNGKAEIPVPRIFWFMFTSYTDHTGVVIMIHNINYSVEIQPNQVFQHRDCTVEICEEANLAHILPPLQFPHILCCKPGVIKDHFQLDFRNGLLKFT